MSRDLRILPTLDLLAYTSSERGDPMYYSIFPLRVRVRLSIPSLEARRSSPISDTLETNLLAMPKTLVIGLDE